MQRHTITLKHLRCFLAVADTGSFTAASARLFLTQSALTATIQQFEAQIGLRMFDRTTRRVALTQDAERFKPEAERIVNNFDSAVGDLMALAQGQRGQVRIGAAASVIHQFVVPTLPKFRAAFAGVAISLRNPAAQQVERMVAEGEVDFAIDSRHQGHAALEYKPLVADRYGVVCHRDSALARAGGPLRWADLLPEQYVAFSADTGIGQFLRSHAAHWPALGGMRDEVASTASLFAVLSMGDRYSVLPAMALRGPEYPALVFRELRAPVMSREICLITRRARSLSPSAQRLLDMLLADIRAQALPPGVTLAKRGAGRRLTG